jgi:hypothetical protein
MGGVAVHLPVLLAGAQLVGQVPAGHQRAQVFDALHPRRLPLGPGQGPRADGRWCRPCLDGGSSTSAHSGKPSHSELGALSADERRSLLFDLKKLERPGSPKPGGGSALSAPAPGDGKAKTKGSALWPKFIRTPCTAYVAVEACDRGTTCHRCCYLTKDRQSASPSPIGW